MKPTEPPRFDLLASEMNRLRVERGVTFEELAEASGLSRRGVIALERGERDGTLASWFRVAQGLGISFSEFVRVLD